MDGIELHAARPEARLPGNPDLIGMGEFDIETRLPSPAPASVLPDVLGDPFAAVNVLPRPRWLLLVSCNRPADVGAVLDSVHSSIPHPVLTGLLRSWEERFGMIPVQIDAASVTLHISAPPTTLEQAEALVAEIELAQSSSECPAGQELLRQSLLEFCPSADVPPFLR
jgi:Domain of unknown function (DUF4253)